jgi:beta-lactamase class A
VGSQALSLSAFDSLDELLQAHGDVSVWLGGLSGEPWFMYRADVEHYACSTIKVALVLAAYREAEAGHLDIDRLVRIHDEFDSRVAGYRFTMSRTDDEDPAPWQRLGEDVALRWLACRAIVRSSNLATNLLLDAVGLGAVADVLRACGTKRTAMTRGIEDIAARDAGAANVVTARDLAVIFQSIASVSAGSDSVASPKSLHELRGFLGAQQLNDGIPAGLPRGVLVEHKTGSIEGVSHDVGIVHPPDGHTYVLAVCTTTGLPDAEASRLIADVSAAAWHARR